MHILNTAKVLCFVTFSLFLTACQNYEYVAPDIKAYEKELSHNYWQYQDNKLLNKSIGDGRSSLFKEDAPYSWTFFKSKPIEPISENQDF